MVTILPTIRQEQPPCKPCGTIKAAFLFVLRWMLLEKILAPYALICLPHVSTFDPSIPFQVIRVHPDTWTMEKSVRCCTTQ